VPWMSYLSSKDIKRLANQGERKAILGWGRVDGLQ